MFLHVKCHLCTNDMTVKDLKFPVNWHKIIFDAGWLYNPKEAYFICPKCRGPHVQN